ncbi:FecR family protein [Rhodospirillum rubrum]|nr:FecR domain-containing protein [Rhodospirillum rubrum]
MTTATYTHEDPVVDAALDWFTRLRAGTPDDATLRAFRAWRDGDPRHAREFRALEELWGAPTFAKAATLAGARPAAPARPSRAPWRRRLAFAASLALVLAAIWRSPDAVVAWRADYLTATGERERVTLPDGSTMILNTASAVALDFAKGERAITLLAGEAFFDVRHDADHPFTVTGRFGEVRVEGTAFSVEMKDDRDEIVLERGAVAVRCVGASGQAAALHPGEAVSVTATALSPVRRAAPEHDLAWRNGRIRFDERPLGAVVEDLRRYHKGPIFVLNDAAEGTVVSGNYRLDDIAGALRTLAAATGAEVIELPAGVVILR